MHIIFNHPRAIHLSDQLRFRLNAFWQGTLFLELLILTYLLVASFVPNLQLSVVYYATLFFGISVFQFLTFKVKSQEQVIFLFLVTAFSFLILMRLQSEPLYMMDFIILPACASFAYLTLNYKKMLMVSSYLFFGILLSSFIVYSFEPFEVVYTNKSSEASSYFLLVTSPAFIFFLIHMHNKAFSTLFDSLDIKNLKLESMVRDNRTLLSVVMHDLNNHLMAAKMASKTIDKNPRAPVILENSLENIKAIIENMKRYRILTHSSSEVKKVPITIQQVVENAEYVFAPELKNKSIEIHFKCELPSNKKLDVDPVGFSYNVVNNLVSNAIKFSNLERSISIFAKEETPELVKVSVTNIGPITSLERLNDIIHKGNSDSTEGTLKETGQGLGLQIVKFFTGKMDIKLSVAAEIINGEQHTTFSLVVPSVIVEEEMDTVKQAA